MRGAVDAPEREPKQSAHRGKPARDRRGRKLPSRPGASEIGRVVGEHAHVDAVERGVAVPLGEVAQVGPVRAASGVGDPRC
jgi:hypothetical protein